MKKASVIVGMALCFFGQVQAQNDDFGDDFKEDFESFRRAIHKDFNNFRKKINKEYAEFLKNPWEVRGSILMGNALRAYTSATMHSRANRACPFGSLHLQGWLCLPPHHGRVNPSVIRR